MSLLSLGTDMQQDDHPTTGSPAAAGDLEMEPSEESFPGAAETSQRALGVDPPRTDAIEQGLQAADFSSPAQVRKEECLIEVARLLRELGEQPLGVSDPAIKLTHRCLLEQFQEMLGEQQRAWDGVDPEGVHKMRVATRRIRAAFRAFKGVLPAATIKEFNSQFKWVGDVLGAVRDLDVYQENLRHYTAEIPEEDGACLVDYQQHLAESWRHARDNLLACLSSHRILPKNLVGLLT